jgi:hypothetical protein
MLAVTADVSAQTMRGEWSKPDRGVSVRLHLEREDLGAGVRLAVYLELRNQSARPLDFSDQPRVTSELLADAGNPVASSPLVMSGPIPSPQRIALLPGQSVRLRVDMQTVGAPAKSTGKTLVAVGGSSWELYAGSYVLKVTVLIDEQAGVVAELSPPATRFTIAHTP